MEEAPDWRSPQNYDAENLSALRTREELSYYLMPTAKTPKPRTQLDVSLSCHVIEGTDGYHACRHPESAGQVVELLEELGGGGGGGGPGDERVMVALRDEETEGEIIRRYWEDGEVFESTRLDPLAIEGLGDWFERAGVPARCFEVRRLKATVGGSPAVLHHVYYGRWPDGSFPREGSCVPMVLWKIVRALAPPGGRGKIVVHCKAGVSRTGTFVTFGSTMESPASSRGRDDDLKELLLRNARAFKDSRPGGLNNFSQFRFLEYALPRCLALEGAPAKETGKAAFLTFANVSGYESDGCGPAQWRDLFWFRGDETHERIYEEVARSEAAIHAILSANKRLERGYMKASVMLVKGLDALLYVRSEIGWDPQWSMAPAFLAKPIADRVEEGDEPRVAARPKGKKK